MEKFVKRVDVIRHFLSKVSRSILQMRDITVRLYRFANSDKFKALVTAKFWSWNSSSDDLVLRILWNASVVWSFCKISFKMYEFR